MSSPQVPESIHAPSWHATAKTPVVDNKYADRVTGELRSTTDEPGIEYCAGPPDVDIIIKSQHVDTSGCCSRSAHPIPMEGLLCQIMKVVGERKLEVDSVMATPYAIPVILTHEMTKDEFYQITGEMIWGHGEGEEYICDTDDEEEKAEEDEVCDDNK